MIPIETVREEKEKIKNNLDRRGVEFPLEELREKDRSWRENKKELDKLRHRKNEVTEKIAEKKKEGEDAEELINEMKELKEDLEELKEETKNLKDKRDELWMKLPNLLEEDVPEGEDEDENVELRREGGPKDFEFNPKTHIELAKELDIINSDKASSVTGEGFYYLKKELAQLDYALQMFAADKLIEKGYELVEPPYMLREETYKEATSADKFKEDMYGVKETDKYLIGTSEHPLVAMHKNDVFEKEDLPKKYVGISPCFRKEAGTHGKYMKGLFRMHQFNKVEQVIFCEPGEEEKHFEEIQKNTEELYNELELPYRVVFNCSGDTPNTQAKTHDTELLMADGEYREAGSNSITKDYQTRRLNIKYEKEKYGERDYPYTLNNTAIATSRTMVAILENNQTEEGNIKIPKALRKYMNGKKIIKK